MISFLSYTVCPGRTYTPSSLILTNCPHMVSYGMLSIMRTLGEHTRPLNLRKIVAGAGLFRAEVSRVHRDSRWYWMLTSFCQLITAGSLIIEENTSRFLPAATTSGWHFLGATCQPRGKGTHFLSCGGSVASPVSWISGSVNPDFL